MNGRERFIKACRRESVDRAPVWMMRQAGRHLPEYLKLREQYDFLTRCNNPELAAEISLQPWRRYAVDGVVVFSDILLPVAKMGPSLAMVEKVGPVFSPPLRTLADIDKLQVPNSSAKSTLDNEFPTAAAIKILRRELCESAAVIGFVGSPWTIAAYMVEGAGKQNHFKTFLSFVNAQPQAAKKLFDKITAVLIPYLQAQVAAGADAIQVFDSWGGLLDHETYQEFSLPWMQTLVSAINDTGAISVAFVKDGEPFLEQLAASKACVVGIGPNTKMQTAIERIGDQVALQGNLDPEILLQDPQTVRKASEQLLQEIDGRCGHIINLGHGILPATSVESVQAFVETVQQSSAV